MTPKKHNHFGKVLAVISLIAVVVGVGLYTGKTSDNELTGAATYTANSLPSILKEKGIVPGNIALADITINEDQLRTSNGGNWLVGMQATYRNDQDRTVTITYVDGRFTIADGTTLREVDFDGRPIIDAPLPLDAPNRPLTNTLFNQLDILTTPTGLGYFSKYFFKQETLDTWKETVDRQFATYYLGTEYWESEICSLYADRTAEGIAYFTNKIGLSGIAAHVEATRSEPIIVPEGIDTGVEGSDDDEEHGIVNPNNLYLYKITFNVRNGVSATDPSALSSMKFNVYLRGDREVTLYAEDIELKKGEEFGAGGSSTIVQYSKSHYETICIRFDRVPLQWTLHENELCNVIAQLDPTPTYTNSPTDTSTTTTTTTDDGNPVNQI